MTQFWIGGYGPDMEGVAEGFGVLSGDEGREPTTLAYRGAVVRAASPSWLAAHPQRDIVYAALEGSGAVQAFARSGERSFAPLGAAIPAGSDVCHIAVASDGGYLVASCYGDGRVVRIGLDAAGALRGTAIAAAAQDPYGADLPDPGDANALLLSMAVGDREGRSPQDIPAADAGETQDADAPSRVSHAHSAVFLADGRIATTDLGFDLVRIWRPAATGLVLDHEVVLPHGVGPRHMVAHPSGHLHVVTEYSCEVFTLAASPDGHWRLAGGVTVSPIAEVGTDFPAELARSRDGETLYTALRGSNTVAALRVRGAGETVEPLALADSGVDWPRHHLVHDGTLLVAGQRSDSISVLDLDERTGAPGRVRHRTPAPTPTHILLAR